MPAVSGITLGTPRDGVLAALGPPDATSRSNGNGAIVLHYESRGLTLALGPDGGVVALRLRAPATAVLDGLTVGMPFAQAVARLGRPVGRDGETLVFDRGRWLLFVTPDGASVSAIVVAVP
jgi:hypothetical protein